jgi:hypothetical protein
MATKLDASEWATFKQLLIPSSIQNGARAQLLIEEGSQRPLIPI